MALEQALLALDECLAQFEQALDNLLWAVVEAQPTSMRGHALIDYYEGATIELIGLVKEARAAIAPVAALVVAERVGRALTNCQDVMQQIVARFYTELRDCERNEALNGLARQRGGEWARWVHGVQDALNGCPQPLYAMVQTLTPCWLALIDQVARLSVDVRIQSADVAIQGIPNRAESVQKDLPGEGYVASGRSKTSIS
ncbi:MAG: hypothetical protein MI924_01660 [Chloroflexales bacterium]|nr:hypothetical protein [Chloroflexales bacterium]